MRGQLRSIRTSRFLRARPISALVDDVTIAGVVEVDDRKHEMDARFDQVEARFVQVDARFAQVDARFDALEARVTDLHAETRRRIDVVAEQGRGDIALIATGLASMSATLERSMSERGTVLAALDNHQVRHGSSVRRVPSPHCPIPTSASSTTSAATATPTTW